MNSPALCTGIDHRSLWCWHVSLFKLQKPSDVG